MPLSFDSNLVLLEFESQQLHDSLLLEQRHEVHKGVVLRLVFCRLQDQVEDAVWIEVKVPNQSLGDRWRSQESERTRLRMPTSGVVLLV